MLIQDDEFETKILALLEVFRPASGGRQGLKSINRNEFVVLRELLKLPFASAQLGYADQEIRRSKKGSGLPECATVLEIPIEEVEITDYVASLKREIKRISRENISKGVTESAFCKYYTGRLNEGLSKPVYELTKQDAQYNYYATKPYDVEIGRGSGVYVKCN